MKYTIILIMAITIGFTACNPGGKTKNETAAFDTITKESGLKYYYLKKGNGSKIQPGSKVDTYLSLMVNDSLIWNTDQMPDSIFSFVADNTPLIKGFTEVVSYLREGDEIVAILPYQIAYGKYGRGAMIPAKATLVYNQFKVKKVYPPKKSMADILFKTLKDEGFNSMISMSKEITEAKHPDYLIGESQWVKLWRLLDEASMNKEALQVLDHYKSEKSKSRFHWYRVQTLNKLERYEEGIKSLVKLMKADKNYHSNPEAQDLLRAMQAELGL